MALQQFLSFLFRACTFWTCALSVELSPLTLSSVPLLLPFSSSDPFSSFGDDEDDFFATPMKGAAAAPAPVPAAAPAPVAAPASETKVNR